MANIIAITGSGISLDSGIPTFRGKTESLYDDENIMSLISSDGLKNRREELYEWINSFKDKYGAAKPNSFHEFLGEIDDLVIFTQNVDELHESGGSKAVYHLHGNVFEYTIEGFTLIGDSVISRCEGPFELGLTNEYGALLRPNVVLFNEMPFHVERLCNELEKADILILAGCSLEIMYLNMLMKSYHKQTLKVVVINPEPEKELHHQIFADLSIENIKFIETGAVESIGELKKILTEWQEHIDVSN